MWVPAEGRFQALEPHVTFTALHSGLEQDEPLRYLPGTRDGILSEIDAWSQDLSSPPILCLTGTIGSGKTVVAREVAVPIWGRAHLAGEFFFWGGDPARSGLRTFVTTLTHGVGFILPSASKVIRATLDSNPSILEATPEEQWESLIIQPLETLAGEPMSFRPLFIIEGIDQCSSKEDQLWVVRKMVELCTRFPVGVLLSSRPEYHLQVELQRYQGESPSLFCPIIDLVDNDEVRQQIRQLLYPISIYVDGGCRDPNWKPSMLLDETFESLVSDACGQFIFVEGIQQYLYRNDVSAFDQREQLAELHINGLIQAKAFPSVDKRYDALMSSVESNLTDEQKVLRNKIFYYLLYIRIDTIYAISLFWDTSPAAVRAVLSHYHSVLRVSTTDDRLLRFDAFTFQTFLCTHLRGGKDAKHYIAKSSLSIDAFERSIHLAERRGLRNTIKAPIHLFSLWLKLAPEIDVSSAEAKQRSDLVLLLKRFDFSAWVSEWYQRHKSDELDEEYKKFRAWLQPLSKVLRKKYDEKALSRVLQHASMPERSNIFVRLLRALLPRWFRSSRASRSE